LDTGADWRALRTGPGVEACLWHSAGAGAEPVHRAWCSFLLPSRTLAPGPCLDVSACQALPTTSALNLVTARELEVLFAVVDTPEGHALATADAGALRDVVQVRTAGCVGMVCPGLDTPTGKDLLRRSNLGEVLAAAAADATLPPSDLRVLVHTGVLVTRKPSPDLSGSYLPLALDKQRALTVVTVPWEFRVAALASRGYPVLYKNLLTAMAAAARHGVRYLVLDTWDCAAARLSPSHMACLFRDAAAAFGASFAKIVITVQTPAMLTVFKQALGGDKPRRR
jgi:hypothetical protein